MGVTVCRKHEKEAVRDMENLFPTIDRTSVLALLRVVQSQGRR